jgi:hypothetical protein
VLGGLPNLSDLDSRGDLKWAVDFRQIYTSILEDWMGMSRNVATEVLGGEFTKLPLFAAPSPGSVDRNQDIAMAGMSLAQNRPNPASVRTTIDFALPRPGFTRLSLFAPNGELALTLLSRTLDAGEQSIAVDVTALAPGSYLYTLEFGGYRLSKKLLVVH